MTRLIRSQRGRPLRSVSVAALALAFVFACSSTDSTGSPAGAVVAYKSLPPGRTIHPPVSKEIGPEGGELTVQDGTTLEIPAGALTDKRAISVQLASTVNTLGEMRYFVLTPEGTRFVKPAILRIAFKDDDIQGGRVVVRNFSESNPELSDGHKKAKFQTGKLAAVPRVPGQLAFEVPHFSFWQANSGVDRPMHLVTDIPARELLPGDMLFMLTSIGGGPNWSPGHVAVFSGGRKSACAPEFSDELIEATGDAVRVHSLETEVTTSVDPETKETIKNESRGVKDEDAHFYLGAFRPDGGLNSTTRDVIMTWLRKQVGKPYAYVGGRWTDYESFSCVGLAEAALDVVDKGVLNDFREFSVSTPLEMFQNMKPVREVRIFAGDDFQMPVLGTVAHPDTAGIDSFEGKFCAAPQPCCSATDRNLCNTFTIEERGKPAGSTFTPDGPGRYLFKWKPTEADAAPGGDGKTHELRLVMKSPKISVAGRYWGRNDLGPQEIDETFKITVFPCTFPNFSCAAATTPEDKVACAIGKEDARNALVAKRETLTQGGTHPNSNPAIPINQVEGAVDLLDFAVALTGIDAQEIVDWNAVLACANAPAFLTGGVTLCAPQPIAPSPGSYVVAQVKLKDDVPLMPPSTHFQYGFVFDRDGDESNNYRAKAPYSNDSFDNSDRWYEALYTPVGGWSLKVSNTVGNVVTPSPSAARLIVAKNTLTLVAPRSEVGGASAKMRVTAFQHDGTYGQTPPYVYSADTHRAVGQPLIPVP